LIRRSTILALFINPDNHTLVKQPSARESDIYLHQVVSHARSYVGAPYQDNPLLGSHDKAEKFVTSKSSFDCVTFVETVLAECLSSQLQTTYEHELRNLRYKNGFVDWLSRLHYFSEWLTVNASRGFLSPVFSPPITTRRTLSLLKHYRTCDVALAFLPLSELATARSQIKPGDIIAFGTTNISLDVSHTGFLARSSEGEDFLIHATKTFGKVIEEPLDSFLKRFGECPGLLVYRPLCPPQN
jgi:hypothetical protein